MDTDLRELEAGLTAVSEYDHCLRAKEDASLKELANSLDSLAHELDRLNTEHDTYLKATKGRFNVFTALLKAEDEVRLHTRWLAYLLDPRGGHDCGDLFLRLFRDQLRQGVQRHTDDLAGEALTALDGLDAAGAVLEKERRIDEGQIDILIGSQPWGAIAIENKVRAGEGNDQIARYAKYLEREYIKRNLKGILLFLTPDGRASASVGDFTNSYFRVSYSVHILGWLEECLRETYQHVNINQALQQYMNVVYAITTGHLPLEKLYMEKILELVERHPAIIKHYAKLGTAIEKLRIQCWNEFITRFAWHLKQADRYVYLEGSISLDRKANTHAALVYDRNSFTAAGFQLTVEHGGMGLYVGLTTLEKRGDLPSPTDQIDCFHGKMQTLLNNPQLSKNNYWRGLQKLPCPELSDDAKLADLLGPTGKGVIDNMAAESARTLLHYISNAEAVWCSLSSQPADSTDAMANPKMEANKK